MFWIYSQWRLFKARWRYKAKRKYIYSMPELPEEEKAYTDELSRAVLLTTVAEFAAEKRVKK